MPRISIFTVAVLFVASNGIGCGPCELGQELREERHHNTAQIKYRGCVGKNSEGNYRLQGKFEYFYRHGQKMAEGVYRNGDMRGEKGNHGILLDGMEGEWFVWHENGQKKSEGTFKDGKADGLVIFWYENGQKKSEGTFKDGNADGLVILWQENGQKFSEVTFKNDKKNGVEIFWHENGQKASEETFKDGEPVPGTKKSWNETGKLIQ